MTSPIIAAAAGGEPSGRPARPDRPVRFSDPVRNAAYWARIDRIVDAAPPLSPEQKAPLRTIFSSVTTGTAKEAA
ncbi:hypothetical protein JS756_02980 [Streptomyces actuosus]|uniref:Uncharacterized protein n=1 Tax=Streptomyces actuosus TaxID=1885 RepID=A0ABS2VJ32_STRAS|nr:hypothetical protein [Streptomyces actuosus]MBN0043093.1 hypothetical protein [Streptomyces actuosus]